MEILTFFFFFSKLLEGGFLGPIVNKRGTEGTDNVLELTNFLVIYEPNMLLNEIKVARCPSHQCKASEKPAIVSNLRQNF